MGLSTRQTILFLKNKLKNSKVKWLLSRLERTSISKKKISKLMDGLQH